MATYVNDLRLTELATGEGSGTWGVTTNTNLELVAEAFSFGTEAITTNADTHTTTIADGSTDPGRSMFLKYTGTLDSTCTITIGPNTVSKLWFIENATSGSQSIIIKQGSGATVTIANGQTKAIYSDGAGSGGAMIDALQDLSIPDLFIDDDLTVGDDLTVTGLATVGETLGVTGVLTANAGVVIDNITIDGTEIDLSSGDLTIDVAGDLILDADGADFKFRDGGAGFLTISNSSLDVVFKSEQSNEDILFKGNDGGSEITALTLDMSAAGAATFNSTVTAAGLTVDGTASISSATASDVQLTLTNTDAGSSFSPTLDLHRNSSSPADDDQLGRIRFRGENDASENTIFASISVLAADVTDGTEDGTLRFITKKGGTDGQRLIISSSETVLNESSQDVDFRVESDSNTHMLFVDAENDRVGIGTSSPGQLLDVAGDTAPTIRITNTDTTLVSDQVIGAIEFKGSDASEDGSDVLAAIKAISADATPDSDLAFFTLRNVGAQDDSITERMRIDQSGNVGIGTSSPSSSVHISDSSPILTLTDTDTNADSIISAASSAGNLLIGADENAEVASSNILFRVDGSEKARLTSDGNVGIGSSSPESLLELEATSSTVFDGTSTDGQAANGTTLAIQNLSDTNNTFSQILFRNRNTSKAVSRIASLTDSTGTEMAFVVENNGSPAEVLRIDKTGNVGIGTSSPSSELHVKSTDGEVALNLEATTARLKVNGNNFISATSSVTTFGVNGTERARFDSSGNLLVNGTNATGKLVVDGDANAYTARFNANTTTGQAFGARVRAGTNSSDFAVLVENTSATTMFAVRGDGNVGIGTASPSTALDVSGAATITTADNNAQLTVVSTDTDASVGPRIDFYRNSSSPANGDLLGEIQFQGEDSIGSLNIFATISSKADQVDNGAEDGSLRFKTLINGSLDERLIIDSAGLIQIGNAGSSSSPTIQSLIDPNTGIFFGGADILGFSTGGSERCRLDASGNLLIGTTSTIPYTFSSGTGAGITSTGTVMAGATAEAGLFNRIGSDGSVINFYRAGSLVGSIGIANGDLNIDGDTGIRFQADSLMPRSSGSDADATVDLGLSTHRFKDLHLSGKVLVGDGSESAPSISFGSDTNTGIFLTASDNIGFSAGGTRRAFMSSTQFNMTGNGVFSGSITKGSGSFKIDHPLPAKTDTHHLVHSFVEAPQADNIYRGVVDLVNGSATINIDTVAGMTEGTFVLLNTNLQCFTSNESGWTAVKGSVSGNTLTITAQDNTCTDSVSWMVVGERHDQHMIDTEWTDSNGKVIVEPLKETN